MCDCNSKKNVVDLPHIKIYTKMANYKVKKEFKNTATYFGNVRVRWEDATDETLAWVYEEAKNGSHYVEKIDKINKSYEKSDSKVSKKGSDNKKDSKEE
jgi:hypothetical protein|tara:strand:- start:2420 stop:2716 length:297 start_codon:yes stop_codon:yes gene_type:complete